MFVMVINNLLFLQVVDLVYLQNKDWQELLNGYPEVRYNLYTAALKLKRSFKK